MGGQIVRRKRKGNPPKPDLSMRSGRSTALESRTIVRRSRRRRNVRYSNFIDYGDFEVDDEEEEEGVDGEELRRGRKVKLVVKLSQQRARAAAMRKDIYGFYAEPVDPEELPDYHDIVENLMDFSTVRKKLANGSYATLSQFESDVFLICTNAMQYNAPDTVPLPDKKTLELILPRPTLTTPPPPS